MRSRRPRISFHGAAIFTDLGTDVRQPIARIEADPFIVRGDRVRGFVFDVATGRLCETL
ncbi:hypothetical protein ACIRBZ_01405 [Streptomyces sp. NPDC094038]|uniref:hypothetical protein n=1 Tax=Streptomyces sp. NPDC094038 TaxID=3366055 RepID=UPI003825A215